MHRKHHQPKLSKLDDVRHFLKDKSKRKDLDLSRRDLTDEHVDSVIALIKEIPFLERLDLSSNKFTAVGIKKLLFYFGKLKVLNISRMESEPIDVELGRNLVDFNVLLSILLYAENLEVCNFSYNPLAMPICTMNKYIYPEANDKKSPQNETFRNAYNQLPWRKLISAIRYHKNLTGVDLRHCGLHDEEFRYIKKMTTRSGIFSSYVILIDDATFANKVAVGPRLFSSADAGKKSSSSSNEGEQKSSPGDRKKKRPIAKEIFNREFGMVKEKQVEAIFNLISP